jgi:hypothetical protein
VFSPSGIGSCNLKFGLELYSLNVVFALTIVSQNTPCHTALLPIVYKDRLFTTGLGIGLQGDVVLSLGRMREALTGESSTKRLH